MDVSVWFCVYIFGIMDNFEMFDDDFGDIFITQKSNEDNWISLEDEDNNSEVFRTVSDPQYSDISDFEDEAF